MKGVSEANAFGQGRYSDFSCNLEEGLAMRSCGQGRKESFHRGRKAADMVEERPGDNLD